MSHRASRGGAAQRARATAMSILDWHDARPRASMRSVRGWVWMVLIAATFFWMSNPLAYVLSFYLALDHVIRWTLIVAVASLPWLRLPRIPWPWLVFLGLSVASQLWTIYDPQTDVSIKIYIEMTALAVVVAANCRPEVVCWGLATGGVVVAGLSVYGYHTERPGTYYLAMNVNGVVDKVMAGIGTNENILAYTLVVSLAATLALGVPSRLAPRVAWFSVLGVHAYGLYLANSGTGYQTAVALLVAMAAMAAWPRLASGRSRRALMWTVFSLAGVLAISLVGVSVLLGKQLTTFSGRSVFWRGTIDATLDRAPVLGSGWGAVWEHPWNPTYPNYVSEDIYERAGYALSHGHNFFIDVFPELGLVGVAVALRMVVYAVREVRRCGLHPGTPNPLVGRLLLLVLVALLASGMTEPMLTVPLGWWSFALVAAVARQRVLIRPRPTRSSGRRARSSASSVRPDGAHQLGDARPVRVGDQHGPVPAVEDEHAPGRDG